MTKIDIISGFLGAGKTTLIKKLIAEAFKGEKLVLVENEFGEIGIDGGFMKDAGIEVSEINSGCICCSLKGDFRKALKQVIDTYHPDRVLIEPSGVGKLSDVIAAAKDTDCEDARLNSFTTVVDAVKAKMYLKNFGEFFCDQVASAHTVVLSRSQKLDEAKLNACVELIRSVNPDATVITTPWDEMEGATILGAMEKESDLLANLMEEAKEARHHHHHHHDEDECDDPDCECHHHHDDDDDDDDDEHEHHHHHHHHDEDECGDPECECHHHHDDDDDDDDECDDPECECHHHHGHHHADDVFSNWGVETPKKFGEDELRAALEVLAEETTCGVILRAKGILPSADGGQWLHFDLTPGEYEIRRGSADYTGRLCVIGTKLDGDALKKLFAL